MANNYYMCLLGAMDRLWFHQIILLSQPISLMAPQNHEETPQLIITESFKSPSPSLSLSSLEDEKDEEISTDSLPVSDELDSSDSTQNTSQDDEKKKPKKSRLTNSRIRSHSSSPSTTKRTKIQRSSVETMRLQKSMSCRSLGELELKELKGFMDLGFIFKKEHLSPRMMSLLPGLQRLIVNKNKQINGSDEEEDQGIIRPYLSEAWLIQRPSSPLLNLKLPRVSAAADMKKHLKFWARTVASEIHQES